MATLLLVPVTVFFFFEARGDSNVITDVRLKKVRFYDGSVKDFEVLGYYAGAEGSEVSARIYLQGNTGDIIWISNTTWSDSKYHRFHYPDFDLGNNSFRTFTLTVQLTFYNGATDTISKNIHVMHRPTPYSAQLSRNGNYFMFFSDPGDRFNITVYYNYGPLGQSSVTWYDVDGKEDFRLNASKGCTSVDVYVEDRYGNVNSNLEEVSGMPLSYHHAYDQGQSYFDVILKTTLLFMPMLVGAFLFFRLRKSAVEAYMKKQQKAASSVVVTEAQKKEDEKR